MDGYTKFLLSPLNLKTFLRENLLYLKAASADNTLKGGSIGTGESVPAVSTGKGECTGSASGVARAPSGFSAESWTELIDWDETGGGRVFPGTSTGPASTFASTIHSMTDASRKRKVPSEAESTTVSYRSEERSDDVRRKGRTKRTEREKKGRGELVRSPRYLLRSVLRSLANGFEFYIPIHSDVAYLALGRSSRKRSWRDMLSLP